MYYGQPGGGQYQTMSGPAPVKPKPTKPIIYKIFIVLVIVVIILLGLSITLPWYTEASDGEPVLNYYFHGREDVNSNETKSWDEYKQWDPFQGVYNLTFALVIISLILTILILVGTIAVLIFDIDKKFIILFSLLAFLFCLLAPIVFAALHPGAAETVYENIYETEPSGEGSWDSFFGKRADYSWGPSSGWYLGVTCLILIIIILIMSFKLPEPEPAIKTVQELPAYPTMAPMPPGPYQYGYPPPQQPFYPPPQQPYYPPPQQPYYPPQQPPQFGYP